MPKLLPPGEIARFEIDGHTGPVRVLDETEVARYRAAYEGVERRHPDDLRKMKTKAHLLCPWVDEIARHPRVLDAFEDLIGPDLLCYSMAFRVKANDGRTHAGWHQDTAYTRMRPILAIGALALGPCGREQGCLSVIPGTHHGPLLPHVESADETSILARGQSIAQPVETDRAVDLALQPGELAIFHYNIVHGSRPNISADRRMMLLVEMMPADAYQASGKEAAMLVRGEDRHRHFEPDRPAVEEFGPAERQAWQKAVDLRAKVVFEDSQLPVSAAYGGDKKNG
ncbi:MAG: phytanoyl-CoA dioxygenase family protein [Alphaproteobacteria bacterium]|nr:phytanoyl-CoA dioxygenase family protein [Alphaproteobacteria bacterium]